MINNNNCLIKLAKQKGYYILNGEAYSKNKKRTTYKNPKGYLQFGIRKLNGKIIGVLVHRLVAYQKYGEEMFKEGIVVRHLDGNPLNNSEINIAIGTEKDNMNDIDVGTRRRRAIIASSYVQKHNHKLILEMHKSGKSYSEIMKELGISSKGTLSFIVNKSMQVTENLL
jgi:hypothetical protein